MLRARNGSGLFPGSELLEALTISLRADTPKEIPRSPKAVVGSRNCCEKTHLIAKYKILCVTVSRTIPTSSPALTTEWNSLITLRLSVLVH